MSRRYMRRSFYENYMRFKRATSTIGRQVGISPFIWRKIGSAPIGYEERTKSPRTAPSLSTRT